MGDVVRLRPRSDNFHEALQQRWVTGSSPSRGPPGRALGVLTRPGPTSVCLISLFVFFLPTSQGDSAPLSASLLADWLEVHRMNPADMESLQQELQLGSPMILSDIPDLQDA